MGSKPLAPVDSSGDLFSPTQTVVIITATVIADVDRHRTHIDLSVGSQPPDTFELHPPSDFAPGSSPLHIRCSGPLRCECPDAGRLFRRPR